MLFFGWLNIYAANFDEGGFNLFTMRQEPGKQLFWIATSAVWVAIILIMDGKFYTTFSYVIYSIMMLLLIGVVLFGKEIGGARSWYALGNFSMQPSEFAKIGTLLALSKYLSQLNMNLQEVGNQLKAFAILTLPILLIMLQPDAGSAIVFASLFLVLYREGINGVYLVVLGLAIALFISTLKFDQNITMLVVALFSGLYAYLLKKNKQPLKYALVALILSLGFVKSVDFLYAEILKKHQQNRIDLI